MVLILRSCHRAWVKDLKHYGAKRDAADLSVKDANQGVFGQALIKSNELQNFEKYSFDCFTGYLVSMHYRQTYK